jgi:hypothetical protein
MVDAVSGTLYGYTEMSNLIDYYQEAAGKTVSVVHCQNIGEADIFSAPMRMFPQCDMPFFLTHESRIPYNRGIQRDFFSKSLLGASFRHGQDTFDAAPPRMPPLFHREAGAVI